MVARATLPLAKVQSLNIEGSSYPLIPILVSVIGLVWPDSSLTMAIPSVRLTEAIHGRFGSRPVNRPTRLSYRGK